MREDKKTIELLETDIDDLAETLCTSKNIWFMKYIKIQAET